MNKLDKASKKEKMFSLIEQWKESGLPKQVFCNQHQIAYHVFYYYHNKYHGINKKRVRKQIQETGFLPVKVTPIKKSLQEVEIVYPNGVALKCKGLPNSIELKELINLL